MEVRADKAKIWRKDYQTKDGKEFYRYSVGVSKKNEDGTYVNAYMPVKFSKKSGAPERIENGTVCSIEGFMSVESYTDKEGNTRNNPMIIVMSVEFDTGFSEIDDDIDF